MIFNSQVLLKRALMGLVILLCFLLAAEGVSRVLVNLGQPPLSLSRHYDDKYRLAAASIKDNAVFFMGDSLVDLGFYPELLKKRAEQAGVDVEPLNLGVSGNSPEMTLRLLETAVKAGTHPRLVLLDVSPRVLDERDIFQEAENGLDASYLGRCILKSPKSLDNRLDCRLSQVSYLFRYRSYLSQKLKSLMDILSFPDKKPPEDVEFASGRMSARGWSPYAVVFGQALPTMVLSHQPNGVRRMGGVDNILGSTAFSGKQLEPIARFCKQHGIPLILVWMPEHSYMDTHFSKKNVGKRHALIQQVERLAEKWQVRFLNFRTSVPDEGTFADPQHLNIEGALIFTNKLADRLLAKPYYAYLTQQGELARQ